MLDMVPEGFIYIDDKLYKKEVLTVHVAYKMWKARARRKKLALMYQRQNGVCPCCQRTMYLRSVHGSPNPERSAKRYATVEHILPVSQGGTDEMTNLVATCYQCNSLRGVMDFEEFKALRANPGKFYGHRSKVRRKNVAERKKRNLAKKEIKNDMRVLSLAWLSTLIPGLMEYCLEESYG